MNNKMLSADNPHFPRAKLASDGMEVFGIFLAHTEKCSAFLKYIHQNAEGLIFKMVQNFQVSARSAGEIKPNYDLLNTGNKFNSVY